MAGGIRVKIIVGIDIGGTKCAISFAHPCDGGIEFLDKTVCGTKKEDFQGAMQEFVQVISKKLRENPHWRLTAIGISCGGPLDAQKGLILAPPNLPRWDRADVFTPLKNAFGVPVMIQNDADACALAEWTMGAGKGCRNMIFLTFGTGMGAGLILNNELYTGTTGTAGEVGHIRLEENGPYGYGKYGSFEGFCSGGGIADLGRQMALEAIRQGKPPLFCREEKELEQVSSKTIADALERGDPLAEEIFDSVATHLGRGLAVLIDILNPEKIVIGSIFVRQRKVLEEKMTEAIRQEALADAGRVCEVVPASLGEMLGDYAAVSVGLKAYQDFCRQENGGIR